MKKIFILSLICICFYGLAAEAQMAPAYYEHMRRNQEKQKRETYYDDKGFSYQKSGNITYKSNGTAYYKSGNTITGSDGSRYEKSNRTIYHNGREKCYINGRYVTCY